MPDSHDFIVLILGSFLGWAINWFFSWFSLKDADIRAKTVSDEMKAIFRAFAAIAEDRRWVEWKRDEGGNITTARVISLAGHAQATAAVRADLETGPSSVDGIGGKNGSAS